MCHIFICAAGLFFCLISTKSSTPTIVQLILHHHLLLLCPMFVVHLFSCLGWRTTRVPALLILTSIADPFPSGLSSNQHTSLFCSFILVRFFLLINVLVHFNPFRSSSSTSSFFSLVIRFVYPPSKFKVVQKSTLILFNPLEPCLEYNSGSNLLQNFMLVQISPKV